MQTHTLVGHSDIQNWVMTRKGQPAISRVPDKSGDVRARLALNFHHAEAAVETPSQDDGMSPCSWTAWLAELDRQNLALKVSDRSLAVEFVARTAMN